MAEYEREKAAYDQQQYAAQQAAYQQQQAYAQQSAQQLPPKKGKGGLIAAIAIILVLLLVGCGVGGFFAVKAFRDKAEDTLNGITDPGTSEPGDSETGDSDAGDVDTGNALDSYPTAEEAVVAQLAAAGIGDWVYQLYDEGDGYATYWAGPPSSEFVDEIYLEQNADGTWSVIEVNSIGYGGDVSGSSYDAEAVVWDHLIAVSEDRGLDAQALTIDPFRSDAAAAQVSAGGLGYFEVIGSTEQSDGTFWVQSVQEWYGASQYWEYYVVPTEAGYRIADLRPF
jgi:ABC-type Na+ efflux pump permease subunit